MNPATPQMRAFAKRLIAYETKGTDLPRAAFVIPEKLRSPLGSLMGARGFRSLLTRALALAGSEVPWLNAIRITADGALAGFEEIYPYVTPEEYLEGRVVLLAHLLGLLVAFIGQGLTSRLIGEIWPRTSLDEPERAKKGKNDKSN